MHRTTSPGMFIALAAVAVLTAGVVSFFASGLPDALEHSLESYESGLPAKSGPTPVASSDSAYDGAIPDQEAPSIGRRFMRNAFTGIAGTLIVFAVIAAIGVVLKRRGGGASHG